MKTPDNYSYQSEYAFESMSASDVVQIQTDFRLEGGRAVLNIRAGAELDQFDVAQVLIASQKNLKHRIDFDITYGCDILLCMASKKYMVEITGGDASECRLVSLD